MKYIVTCILAGVALASCCQQQQQVPPPPAPPVVEPAPIVPAK